MSWRRIKRVKGRDVNLLHWRCVSLVPGSRKALELAVILMLSGEEDFAQSLWSLPTHDAFLEFDQPRSLTFRLGVSENQCFTYPGARRLLENHPALEARLLELRDLFELEVRGGQIPEFFESVHALIYLPPAPPNAHERLELLLALQKRLRRVFPREKEEQILALLDSKKQESSQVSK